MSVHKINNDEEGRDLISVLISSAAVSTIPVTAIIFARMHGQEPEWAAELAESLRDGNRPAVAAASQSAMEQLMPMLKLLYSKDKECHLSKDKVIEAYCFILGVELGKRAQQVIEEVGKPVDPAFVAQQEEQLKQMAAEAGIELSEIEDKVTGAIKKAKELMGKTPESETAQPKRRSDSGPKGMGNYDNLGLN